MLFNNIESINNESSKNYSIFFEKNNVQSNPQNKYYEEYDLFTDNNIYYDKTVLSKRVNNEMLNNEILNNEYIDENINENKINSFYLNYVNSINYL